MNFAVTLYRLSLSLWVGGVTLFTIVLTPILFRNMSRDQAGAVVGLLFPGYFRWGLCCGGIALVSCLATRTRQMLPVWLLVVMLSLTALQAFYIEPRAAALKQQIPSFETTPRDHPLRRDFSRLHGISALCNLTVLGGGIVLVVLM